MRGIISGGFRDYKFRGWKQLRSPFLESSINEVILQIVFSQSSNVWKLCSVTSDESFSLMGCTGKKNFFLETWRRVSFQKICDWNVLVFKENHVKVKGGIYSIIFLWHHFFVSFSCLKSKNLFFIDFLTCWGPFWLPKL